jgi:ATP-dependent helicase HrpB
VERLHLPIDDVLPELLAVLGQQSSVVLRAPTGAGKTTRVPPTLLDHVPGRLLLLEPRRLAARAAARRMSEEAGTPLGGLIGYQVRFERQSGRDTRILAVTPGILLRLLHDDPYLESTGAVLFDEFHERGLESDLALGIVRLIQQTVRPELRIIVMSATLETEKAAHYLGDCPIIVSEGRLHPVEITHDESTVDAAIERMLDRIDGDILAFLPGLQEIGQTARLLKHVAERHDAILLPLYGDLTPEQQDSALLPQPQRKIVLATNVAETSVTVEGVVGVVDSGLARVMTFDPGVGVNRLQLMPISKASADQRAGRAGRTRPGVCVRLWSELSHRARPEQTDPEIRRVDLAGAVLQLLALGEKDVKRFPWLEPPQATSVEQALELLRRLGALDDGGMTQIGSVLARLPVHPRLGRLLVEGRARREEQAAALAAVLLSERDPFLRPVDRPQADARRHRTTSDVLDRMDVIEEYELRGRTESSLGTLNRSAAKFILLVRDQLVRAVRQEARAGRGQSVGRGETVMRALLEAFPDRLARRREPGGMRGVMVGGRGVRLAPSSAVTDAELFVCVDVDAGERESVVRLASAVKREWLPAEMLTSRIEVNFDETTERVTARKVLRFEDLLIEETPAALPDDEEVARVLIEAAGRNLARVLPVEGTAGYEFLTRVRCLRQWMPELGLPAFDEAELRELLTWVCRGCRGFAQARERWLEQLHGKLTHSQLQAIEREAPERLEVPSGSHLALKYEPGRPPILAVRIQEIFGWCDTPRIAGGRVKVLLHLLAPNYRPQQVTDDLASFWANTYVQVRKELRARYPKHAWPEDPLTATAERHPRRRS